MKNFKVSIFSVLIVLLAFTSCTNEETIVDTQQNTEESESITTTLGRLSQQYDENGNVDQTNNPAGNIVFDFCFDFVYPIDLSFNTGATVTVNSLEDLRITAGGGRLSGGQMQRIALARALYDDPVIVILDEPNSNLDNEGSVALNAAIKQLKAEGRSVLIMAHRPAAIQECDLLLVVDQGNQTAFGPKDDVLRQMVTNHQNIQKTAAARKAQ